MNRLVFRLFSGAVASLFSGAVWAIGLGELHGQPILGQPLQARVEILGAAGQPLDAACFRLVRPTTDDDLPWLRHAALNVRAGHLEIRSDLPLREPVLRIGLQLACGHELYREYIILASPRMNDEPAALERPQVKPLASVATPPKPAPPKPAPRKIRPAPVAKPRPVARPVTPELLPPPVVQQPETTQPDRLLLSGGGELGEPVLRWATQLDEQRLASDIGDVKRDLLRLEFRMLLALHEQATNQLEVAEKLRSMEATLGELRSKAGELSAPAQEAPPVAAPPVATQPPRERQVPVSPAKVAEDDSGLSEWGLYGVLLGGLLALAGWLFWRRRQEQIEAVQLAEYVGVPHDIVEVDPRRAEETDEPDSVDLHFEPATLGETGQVDLELDGGDAPAIEPPAATPQARPGDSLLSMNATTVDEHFEANPVMELADIMLSFGRVKGAAQALQEYIDHNPQEALQPWIRLMDVYRLAGMREEFESVARNLNQNFNVEVQRWQTAGAEAVDLLLDEPAGDAQPPKPMMLEEMTRIMAAIQSMWGDADVVGYLYQLLRDNRGGQRLGFSLPVVEEILFLIELKETANRMEKEKETGEA